jgi:hypothetical protein
MFAKRSLSELDADDAELLDQHLRSCTRCAEHALAERQFDDQLTRAMQAVPVPADFRPRLLTRLSAERREWYSGWPRRHLGITAAAASLLLAIVGVWLYRATRPLPTIDTTVFLNERAEQHGASSKAVEEFFRDKYRIETVAPPGFNYAFLDSFDVNGERLPQLLFCRGTNRAYVWILSSKRYDLATALQQPRAESGGRTVELLPHPSDLNVVYLLEYTGSLSSFLIEEQPTG